MRKESPETRANKALMLYLGLKAPKGSIVILDNYMNYVKFKLIHKQDIVYSYDGITLVIVRGNETHTLF